MLNQNQQKIMVGIATAESIDGNEFQLIVVAALNKAIQSGATTPAGVVAVLEVVKFSVCHNMTKTQIQTATKGELPPGFNNGGRGA